MAVGTRWPHEPWTKLLVIKALLQGSKGPSYRVFRDSISGAAIMVCVYALYFGTWTLRVLLIRQSF